ADQVPVDTDRSEGFGGWRQGVHRNRAASRRRAGENRSTREIVGRTMKHPLVVVTLALLAATPIAAQEIPRVQKTAPVLIAEVKPLYPAGAYRRNVSGSVEVSAVVLPDGTVGDATVTRSLDPDADQEAIRAITQWRFKPGTLEGKPVSAPVSVQ